MPLFDDHLTRAGELVTGASGTSPWIVPAGLFTLASGALESCAQDGAERPVELFLRPGRPLGGYQNPMDGRDLQETPLVVRVSYALTHAGDVWNASGAQSGAGTRGAISTRAAQDAKTMRDALGWQPNWTGLDPHVMDCVPPQDPAAVTELGDRVIYELVFTLRTRASLPGAYGPTL